VGISLMDIRKERGNSSRKISLCGESREWGEETEWFPPLNEIGMGNQSSKRVKKQSEVVQETPGKLWSLGKRRREGPKFKAGQGVTVYATTRQIRVGGED